MGEKTLPNFEKVKYQPKRKNIYILFI